MPVILKDSGPGNMLSFPKDLGLCNTCFLPKRFGAVLQVVRRPAKKNGDYGTAVPRPTKKLGTMVQLFLVPPKNLGYGTAVPRPAKNLGLWYSCSSSHQKIRYRIAGAGRHRK